MKKTCVFAPAIIAALSGVFGPVRAEVRGYEVRREEARPYFVQASSSSRASVGLMLFHGAVYEGNLRASVTAYYEPLFQDLVRELPLAVVYPTGRVGRCPWDKALACWPMWTPWEEAGYIGEVVRRVGADFGPTRWVALGVSNGGFFLTAAIEAGETLPFESVVDCIGGRGWSRKPDIRWTPALTVLAGSRDGETLPSARELRDALETAGYAAKAPLRYIEFDGGHEVPEVLLKTELRRLLGPGPRPRGRDPLQR